MMIDDNMAGRVPDGTTGEQANLPHGEQELATLRQYLMESGNPEKDRKPLPLRLR